MMMHSIQRLLRRPGSKLDRITAWTLVAVGVVAVLFSSVLVLNENLRAYGLCAGRPDSVCSDAAWYSSMAISVGGGIVAVVIGAVLGLRRIRGGRDGAWFPIAGIGSVLTLMGLAILIVKVAFPY